MMGALLKEFKKCQRGAATALAIGVLVILAVMSGIALVANNVLFITSNQQHTALANFAAEAGLRISTLILSDSIKNTTEPNKYDIPPELVGGTTKFSIGKLAADGTPDLSVYYTVDVQREAAGAMTLYTLTVTGHSNNETKTIIGRYSAASGSGGPTPPLNIPDPTMLVHNGGAHNNDDSLTIHPSILMDSNGNAMPIYTTAEPNKINNSTIWGPNKIETVKKDADLPPIPVSFDWKDYQYDQTTLPSQLNSSQDLSGNYYLGQDFAQNTGTIRALNGNHVRIYAKDTINIYGNIITDEKTNIILIAGKDVNINTHGTIKGNIQIFAGRNIIINHSMQGSVLCMSGEDTTINVGHLRYAYIIAYRNMTVYGNNSKTNPVTLIEGAIMAGERLEVNGPTLIFKSDIISNWGTWPPGVTYP